MKKNYLFTILACLTLTTLSAQFFTDDMESYTDGAVIFQDHWTSWSGTDADAIVASSNFAHSGSLSGLVGPSDASDAVLDLRDIIFGDAALEFWMYVPAGKSAYYNFQGTTPVLPQWLFDVFFNADGASGGLGSIENFEDSDSDGVTDGAISFSYPENTWFKIQTIFDVNAGIGSATWECTIDGVVVMPAGTPLMAFVAGGVVEDPIAVGGVDFYSNGANNEYYVDDFDYNDILSVGDFAAKNFSAYPNPVNDILNIQANENISSVSIFNVLGQQVYQSNIDATSSQIDMSQYTSGAYFVKVNIGGTEGTVKVIR